MVRVRPAGTGTAEPPVCNDCSVIVIVPVTLPVCTASCGVENTACVAFAGMVNVAVRPPVENCTAGSSAGLAPPGANASVSVPVIAAGYGLSIAISMVGCCSAATLGGGPLIASADIDGNPTTILCTLAADSLAESVACTVKLKTPPADGVPEIAPVVAFNASPGGSDPPATAHE